MFNSELIPRRHQARHPIRAALLLYSQPPLLIRQRIFHLAKQLNFACLNEPRAYKCDESDDNLVRPLPWLAISGRMPFVAAPAYASVEEFDKEVLRVYYLCSLYVLYKDDQHPKNHSEMDIHGLRKGPGLIEYRKLFEAVKQACDADDVVSCFVRPAGVHESRSEFTSDFVEAIVSIPLLAEFARDVAVQQQFSLPLCKIYFIATREYLNDYSNSRTTIGVIRRRLTSSATADSKRLSDARLTGLCADCY